MNTLGAFRFGWLLMAVLLAGAMTSAPAEPLRLPVASLIDPAWMRHSRWDDGRAEVAIYEGGRVIDGEPVPHRLTLITAREELNLEYGTRAEFPYGQKPLLTVLRQTQIATVPTGEYPWHLMAVVDVERASPAEAVKISISTQERRGSTALEFRLRQSSPTMDYQSHWDGEGSGTRPLAPSRSAMGYFEEHLPLLVRSLEFDEGLEGTLTLYPNQTTGRAIAPEGEPALLRMTQLAEGESEHWQVTIDGAAGRRITFLVGGDSERTLLEMDYGDGRQYRLRESSRRRLGS